MTNSHQEPESRVNRIEAVVANNTEAIAMVGAAYQEKRLEVQEYYKVASQWRSHLSREGTDINN